MTTLNLQTLLRDIDAAQLEMNPLPDHYLTEKDEHSRITYSTMLAAVLMSGGKITDDQSRLFGMLLKSLNLGDIRARLFEQAQEINQPFFMEFTRTIKENDCGKSFFADALILSRLSAPITEAQQQLLSELSYLIALDESALELAIDAAHLTLGLPSKMMPKSKDVDASFVIWQSFMRRYLQAHHFDAEVIMGEWYVDETLIIKKPWRMDGVTLHFVDTASGIGKIITTISRENDNLVKIIDCTFNNPRFEFSGATSLDISQSHFVGEYLEASKITALVLNIPKIHFDSTNFNLKDARAIYIHNGNAEFNKCTFEKCGNQLINGGGIASRSSSKIKLTLTNFNSCIARLGGGLMFTEMNANFESCKLIECKSIAYFTENKNDDLFFYGGGAIFSLAWVGNLNTFLNITLKSNTIYFLDRKEGSKQVANELNGHYDATLMACGKEASRASFNVGYSSIDQCTQIRLAPIDLQSWFVEFDCAMHTS